MEPGVTHCCGVGEVSWGVWVQRRLVWLFAGLASFWPRPGSEGDEWSPPPAILSNTVDDKSLLSLTPKLESLGPGTKKLGMALLLAHSHLLKCHA